MEQEFNIPSKDGKTIYCTLAMPSSAPLGTVVFVHGFTSTADWPTMLLGSWYFRSMGYACCRINLYSWRENARTLMTSDLQTHAEDVDQVVRELRKVGHNKFFAIGHSFGGITLLLTDTAQFNAISFWDPSSLLQYPPTRSYTKIGDTELHYSKGSFEVLISQRYKEGIENFPNELELMSKVTTPSQIVYADSPQAILQESSRRYFEHVTAEKDLVAIPGASHSFTEETACKSLHEHTLRWFSRYL